MSIDLTGKVCLVTGADEGIGRGIVAGFLGRGARVAAGCLHADARRAELAPALALQMDVTQADQVAAAIAATVAEYGRLDVLINNAGIFPRMPADEMTYADWRQVMDVNLDGTWRCCEAAIPHLKASRGCIINVGSITLKSKVRDLSHYRASKGAILGLTRSLALDLGTYGVRVNCIHPGAVQTEGERRETPDAEEVARVVNELQVISGRITPESIEPTFAFFASELSRDITGQSLTVDRGWTLSGD